MTVDYVTRREIDQLLNAAQRERDEQNRRISQVEKDSDQVGVLATQIGDINEKIGGLRLRMDDHDKNHRSNARLAWTLGVTMLASNGGIFALLFSMRR